jgi:hypothetical protein
MTSARVLATFGPSAARLTGRPLRWEPHKPGDADAALSTGSCASSPTASDGDKRSTRQGMQPPAKQLLWNDREARSAIPGCRLTWHFGVRRQGSSPEPVD